MERSNDLELDGRKLSIVRSTGRTKKASDIERGIEVELIDGPMIMDVYFNTVTGNMTISIYQHDLDLNLVERVIQIAKEEFGITK